MRNLGLHYSFVLALIANLTISPISFAKDTVNGWSGETKITQITNLWHYDLIYLADGKNGCGDEVGWKFNRPVKTADDRAKTLQKYTLLLLAFEANYTVNLQCYYNEIRDLVVIRDDSHT